MDPAKPFDPRSITRPAPVLMQYYTIVSLAALIAFPIVWLVHYFKYETLKYRFDDEGVSMSWGILFRREINLTYRRIQDIHLTRNIVQRWMGLATLSIQTASGSSSPEMEIEGVLDFEALRDFLYAKMRGSRGIAPLTPESPIEPADAAPDEALLLLRQIASDLERVSDKLRALEARS